MKSKGELNGASQELAGLPVLTHRRWALPALAAMEGRGGIRFAEILARLGVSRQPLRDGLDALVEAGLLLRHAGHGHPLRPEYLLTPKGRSLAPVASVLWAAVNRTDDVELLGRKWSLPVLAAIERGSERFGAISRVLGEPTPRSLALALQDLEDAGLIRRLVEDGRPPSVRYRPSAPPSLRRALRRLLEEIGAYPRGDP